MLWIYVILILMAFFYSLVSSVLSIGIMRLKRHTARDLAIERSRSSADFPFVSILVPAKDEERHIAACLESLVNQDYPVDRYEIVVVNDRSSDNTPDIVRGYMETYRIVRCVDIDTNTSGLTGKQNAMNEGLKVCKGEIILNTDADCIASPLWVRRIVSYFTDRIGIVTGFHIVHSTRDSRSLFARLQSLDMLFLMDAAAGAIGVNIPTACSGSNLAYRRSILDEIDYFGMRYTITEDTALVSAVGKNTDWSIGVVYDRDAAVLTSAEENIRQFLSQRIRWVLGGQANRSWSQIPLHIIFLFHLCLVISLPFMFFRYSFMIITLVCILTKAFWDFIACWRVCREFRRVDLLKLFIPYEAFMVSYSILTGIGSVFVRKVHWKGELYTRRSLGG